jgi:prophage endopeptidase
MKWFRPWMIWAALVLVLLGALGVQTVRLSDLRAKHADTLREHAEAVERASEKARKTEKDLRDDLNNLASKLDEEKNNAKKREDALVESVRVGNRRLSIAATCPPSQGGGAAPAQGGGAAPQRAIIDPAAAERIIGITRDGDNAIRERNTCIDAYEAVRARINGGE